MENWKQKNALREQIEAKIEIEEEFTLSIYG